MNCSHVIPMFMFHSCGSLLASSLLPSYLLKRNHHKLRSRFRIESNLINSSLCASDWRIGCAIEGVCKMNFYVTPAIVPGTLWECDA